MDGERVWLVERSYSDKGLVTLVYATPDGQQHQRSQRSATMLAQSDVTAGKTVDPAKLDPVTDPDRQERFAQEAARMAGKHQPDDAV